MQCRLDDATLLQNDAISSVCMQLHILANAKGDRADAPSAYLVDFRLSIRRLSIQ